MVLFNIFPVILCAVRLWGSPFMDLPLDLLEEVRWWMAMKWREKEGRCCCLKKDRDVGPWVSSGWVDFFLFWGGDETRPASWGSRFCSADVTQGFQRLLCFEEPSQLIRILLSPLFELLWPPGLALNGAPDPKRMRWAPDFSRSETRGSDYPDRPILNQRWKHSLWRPQGPRGRGPSIAEI